MIFAGQFPIFPENQIYGGFLYWCLSQTLLGSKLSRKAGFKMSKGTI
jgi:hypothetical protein